MMEYIRCHEYELFHRFTTFAHRHRPKTRDKRGRTGRDMTVYRSKFYIGDSYRLVKEELIDGFLIKTYISLGASSGLAWPSNYTIFSCEYFNLTFNVSVPNEGGQLEEIKEDFVRGIRFFLKKYDKKYAANKPLNRLFKWLS